MKLPDTEIKTNQTGSTRLVASDNKLKKTHTHIVSNSSSVCSAVDLCLKCLKLSKLIEFSLFFYSQMISLVLVLRYFKLQHWHVHRAFLILQTTQSTYTTNKNAGSLE